MGVVVVVGETDGVVITGGSVPGVFVLGTVCVCAYTAEHTVSNNPDMKLSLVNITC